MPRLLLLALVPALGGCPPPPRYLITDVTLHAAPVADALVAADCGNEYTDAALRTNAAGRARLELRHRIEASKCHVTVAKEGFPTVEATNVSLCTTPACPATHVELGQISRIEPPREMPLATPYEPLEYRGAVEVRGHVELRDYARPPARDMEVAR